MTKPLARLASSRSKITGDFTLSSNAFFKSPGKPATPAASFGVFSGRTSGISAITTTPSTKKHRAEAKIGTPRGVKSAASAEGKKREPVGQKSAQQRRQSKRYRRNDFSLGEGRLNVYILVYRSEPVDKPRFGSARDERPPRAPDDGNNRNCGNEKALISTSWDAKVTPMAMSVTRLRPTTSAKPPVGTSSSTMVSVYAPKTSPT